ncbi:MAG TPA: lysophospholipid acyltransferase family protein [Bacteroidales bacterium]
MNLFFYLIFRLFISLFKLLPFRLLYLISDVFYYLAFYVLRYRRKIVSGNLTKAFPDKASTEIQRITKQYYRYLADIMVESLKGFTMSPKSIVKRYKVLNPEILEQYYIRKQSVIGVSGHYGNWEWGSISGAFQLKHLPVALYKPLTNPYIDRFLKRNRAKYGTQLASIKETFETFETNKHSTCIYLMIADQSPKNLEKAYWVDFFGLDTPFLHGPEKYARIYRLPVVYIDIRPVKRGFYEIELIPITEAPNDMKDGELTERWVRMLEERITKNPQFWIWSHRRWKRTRQQWIKLKKTKQIVN